jgi:hypothetical protein
MCCTSLRPAVRTVAGATTGTGHARSCGAIRGAWLGACHCDRSLSTRSADCVQWAPRSPAAVGAVDGGAASWLPCEDRSVAAEVWAPWATSGSQQTTQAVASTGATETTATSMLVSTLRR